MYGLDKKINLDFLLNRKLEYIKIDNHSIIFGLALDISICVESHLILRKFRGIVTEWTNSELPNKSQINNVVGRKIVNYKILDNGTLNIKFEGGFSLELFDSEKEFESYTITNKSETIIV